MKTSSTNRVWRSFCHFSLVAGLAALTISCSTSGTSDPSTHIAPVISRSWVKVKSEPPTYYPRGVPKDHPTDYRSGEWIYLEDTKDTRLFIPIHGLLPDKRKALSDEAMAARHPDTIKRINQVDRVTGVKALGSMIIMAPFIALGSP